MHYSKSEKEEILARFHASGLPFAEACRIDLDSRIDESVLMRAVEVSMKAVPLMRCMFDTKKG